VSFAQISCYQSLRLPVCSVPNVFVLAFSLSRTRKNLGLLKNCLGFRFLKVLSQCSTVVRNTVVRATIKVNWKPQILGTRSPQTPESIDLKFDLDDYVGHVTLPKMVRISPAGSAGQRGEV